jgi:hypothetical protein
LFEITISVMITLIGLVKVFNACPLNSGILVELLDEFGYLDDDGFSNSEGKVYLTFRVGSRVDSNDFVLSMF